jgi:hypothetical protein
MLLKRKFNLTLSTGQFYNWKVFLHVNLTHIQLTDVQLITLNA